jgi:hypothetical protein
MGYAEIGLLAQTSTMEKTGTYDFFDSIPAYSVDVDCLELGMVAEDSSIKQDA